MEDQINLEIKSKQSWQVIGNLSTTFYYMSAKIRSAIYEKEDNIVKNYNSFTLKGNKNSRK